MDFSWSYATLLTFFIGLAAGGFIGHYATKSEEREKAKKAAFCPHCGKPLQDTK